MEKVPMLAEGYEKLTADLKALREERPRIVDAIEEARARAEPEPRFEGVSLRQRVVPLVEMLRRCEKAGKEMVWGV